MTDRIAKPASRMTQATRLRLEAQLADPNVNDQQNPNFLFSLASTDLLLAAADGRIDLGLLVRTELANRGLDLNGEWIGFQAARKLHGLEG